MSASKHLPLPFRVPGNFALPPTTANSAGEPSVVDYIMPSKDETDLSPPIAKIDPKSARQISSGQVVVDLAGAVKELVENALDAHASSIELRIAEDSGVVEIECVDNGHGIAPRDFALVAMPSATSKLADFKGLQDLQTFGFRGEALASLCELVSAYWSTDPNVESYCLASRVG